MSYKQRINWIDWAKSVSMFLVVLGHCHLETSHIATQVIYSFHIPLFYFLSGLLCSNSFSKRTLLRDIKFIILPYCFYGTFTIFVHTILSRTFSVHYILAGLWTLLRSDNASIGAIWFLPALFVCKQLFYLIKCVWNGTWQASIFLFVVLLFLPYYISYKSINLPLFADSALFGLPFFLMGNKSIPFIERWKHKTVHLLIITTIMLPLTAILSYYNGFVSIAVCNYGNCLLLYYTNAITGIATIIGICLLFNMANRHSIPTFITITSYGTIVILGFHGIILLFLQYYIPVCFNYYTPTISFTLAIIYAIIVYIICYTIIIIGNHYCPNLLGLKKRIHPKKEGAQSI